jgi:hypothetical protein
MPRFSRNKEGDLTEDGRVLQHYEATPLDILAAVEAHGREISLTKLQRAIEPAAHEHHFKYVHWRKLKMVTEGMVVQGLLKKRPTLQGFYRYDLPHRDV